MNVFGWIIFWIVISAIVFVFGVALNWTIWTFRDYRKEK